ncbi:hypothetical protein CI238_12937 [Colletotrichum incanum]|uniref:Uncharacterized protein n=1 Tax=Colletotrichum incanum TaxID=1573173 RepID=A0A166UZF7_COLIC|nr:hypothetical protein CI238_12937 [Colletotrichum incanum]
MAYRSVRRSSSKGGS